ncbi:MAG: hypothetical protein HND42_08350 [Armatimonadetes bacterium]|nr:hypothetical protein [Armatimonadota bacterium]NOG93235.1 hypothetical protein [Armatimonadota bacterium]
MWAGSYLYAVVKELQQPRQNLSLRYETEDGYATLRIEMFSFDLSKGAFVADGVTVRDSEGRSAVRAARVELTVALPWTSNPSHRAKVFGGEVSLRRMKDGKFDLNRFLPKLPEERKEPVGYEVVASNIAVHFVDESVESDNVWDLHLDRATVSGAAESATILAVGEIGGAGALEADLILRDGQVVSANAETTGLELGRLRRYLWRTPELASESWIHDVSLGDGHYAGSAAVRLGGDRARFEGKGLLKATDVVVSGRRIQNLTVEGSFNQSGVRGEFVAEASGADAKGEGVLLFEPSLVFYAEGTGRAQSPNALNALLPDAAPEDLRFRDAAFTGSVGYDGGWLLDGSARAAEASWTEYALTDVTAAVVSDRKNLRLANAKGRTAYGDAKGTLSLGLAPPYEIAADVRATGVDLEDLPKLPREYVQGGRVDIAAQVTGTIADPVAVIDAKGFASVVVTTEEVSMVEPVDVSARGTLRDGILKLDALALASPTGFVRGSGTVETATGKLDLHLVADSLALGAIPLSPAKGTGYALVDVNGSFEKPVVSGTFEVYAGAVGEVSVPFVSGKLGYADDVLAVQDIVARSGVSLGRGDVFVDFAKGGALSGSGEALDVGFDAYTDGRVVGLGSGAWTLSGTLDDPIVDGSLQARGTLLDKVSADSLSVSGRWRGGALDIRDAQARFGEGVITASGRISPTGDSNVNLSAENLPASIALPYLGPEAVLDGSISGTARVGLVDLKPDDGEAEFELSEILLNDEVVGAGTLRATMKDGLLQGSAEIGSLGGYYVLENLTYNFDERSLTGTVSALGADLNTLARIGAKYLDKRISAEDPARAGTQEWTTRSDLLDGSLSFHAAITGPIEDPEVTATLSVEDVEYDGHPAGELAVAGGRKAKTWEVSTLDWTGPLAHFSLSPGTRNYLEEGGAVHLDGEFRQVDLSWFQFLDPAFAGVQGTFDVPFVAEGPAGSPQIRTAISASGFRYGSVVADAINIGPINIQDGSISADYGVLLVRGFLAELSNLNVPFRYPFEFPEDQNLSGVVNVQERDLDAIGEFLSELDVERTEGVIRNGSLTLNGNIREPYLLGNISAEAKSLKFSGFDTEFSDVFGELSLRRDDASGRRYLRFDLSSGTTEKPSLLAWAEYDFERELLSGNARADRLQIHHRTEDGLWASASVSTTGDGIRISGDPTQPEVSGHLVLEGGGLELATSPVVEPSRKPYAIDPKFDLGLTLSPAEISNGPLQAVVTGSGRLGGTLNDPRATMTFAVQGGEIELPTGRIRLEDGGTVHLRYTGTDAFATPSSMEVDLRAKTSFTALRDYGLQRYVADLHITGDLLAEDALQIDATTDPPDLSRDEILAILGQRQLFEDLSGVVTGNFSEQIGDILRSVAPVFLNPLTRDIERTLGLDFISIDFTRAGAGVLTLAKGLGSGFFLEYQAPLLDRDAVDFVDKIQISYRPVTKNELLRRLGLALSYDRTGEWRFSLTYSRRF